jgi:hypothetical protein
MSEEVINSYLEDVKERGKAKEGTEQIIIQMRNLRNARTKIWQPDKFHVSKKMMKQMAFLEQKNI